MNELIIAVFSASGFWALLQALILWVAGRKRKRDDRIDSLAQGVQALLRDAIIDKYDKYSRRGFCTLDERTNVKDIYDAYHRLGGNDIATDLVDRMMELPTEAERRT